jgi:hypothetical protein
MQIAQDNSETTLWQWIISEDQKIEMFVNFFQEQNHNLFHLRIYC